MAGGGTRTRRVESAHAWNPNEKVSPMKNRGGMLVAGGGLPPPRARSAIGSTHACVRRDENPKGRVRQAWNPNEKASTMKN